MATPTSPTNLITPSLTGPLTMSRTPTRSTVAPTSTRSISVRPSSVRPSSVRPSSVRPTAGANRVAIAAAALALLVGVLLCAFAIPASAATTDNTTGPADIGSGVGVTTPHSAAGHPIGSSDALVFAGLCLVGIVATAGGVLWYTVRTRRTLD